jgi:outer membrane protein OmpA-like peptidoglycan-associated protein
MKNFVLMSAIMLLTIGWGNRSAKAQDTSVPALTTGNYLTIGAFQIRKNALEFKTYVNLKGQYQAEIGYLPSTKFNYVYIKTYRDPTIGYPDVWDLRESTEFNDTWVFSVSNDLLQSGLSRQLDDAGDFRYYLTIGTFAIKQNAVNFLSYVQQKNEYNVHVVYSPYTEYFYVYVKTYPTFISGSPSVFQLRKQTEFDDTWLFSFNEAELIPEAMIINTKETAYPHRKNGHVVGGAQKTNDLLSNLNQKNSTLSVLHKELALAHSFKELREQEGLTDEEIINQHQQTAHVLLSIKLSYLNNEGLTVASLSATGEDNILDERDIAIAGMIGAARKQHPELTNEQEDEIFNFLTKGLGQFVFEETEFLKLVDIAVNKRDYHEELPLDLESIIINGEFRLIDAEADSVMQANAELVEVDVVPLTYIDEEGNYKMFFDAYYTKSKKRIDGSVLVIDPVRLKQMSVEKSNKLVRIPDPNNQSQSIQLIIDIFGYKKVQHDFKMSEPFDSLSTHFLHFKGDVLMVDFPLNRYDAGDIATMYNVYFFKDAAVMKPESRFELKALLEMLQENLNYKIRIHGHTNGNAPGKIIQLEDEATDFFSLTKATKEGFGSAKELSTQRGQVIKDYLVANGVDPTRAQVKGWGGKKPIYDKFDRRALKNVRVEIEILEN